MLDLVRAARPRAAKDASMAGIVGTVAMLAEASGCGAELDIARIPHPANALMADWLTCFPGYAVITADRRDGPPMTAPGTVSHRCGRLTAAPGTETDPVFSPDGSQLAFTGEYDGNTDVYLVPASGGVPRRLTYHPGLDAAVGWSPDGMQILFRSSRSSFSFGFNRLFTVSQGGGFPSEIPLPRAEDGSYSPDGSRMAYVPLLQWQRAWKRYRGGQTKPIWIVNLAAARLPWTCGNSLVAAGGQAGTLAGRRQAFVLTEDRGPWIILRTWLLKGSAASC